MAFISERILEEVREANDIVEVISSHLPLKKSGKNYKSLCPFHSEKTASFIVNPEKQIFHCFGCSAGGNIFTFVMKMENLTFPESVTFLAEKAGIKLEWEKGSEEKKNLRRELIRVNNAAVTYFHHNLTRTKRAIEYLARRGITESSIKRFKLGYAQKAPDALKKGLKVQGFSEELLLKAGLLRLSEEKDFYYDYFRDRIIFPIQNTAGECLAFGGRVLDESVMPKYLNSPESPIYHKGRVLYGLSLAKETISKKKRAIIVEGYLDLIKTSQGGIENIVAPLGTALTIEHIRLLKRYTENVVLSPDSDEAGHISACRSLELLLEEGLRTKVVFLPEGYDPDRYITEKGAENFQTLIDKAPDPFDYKMRLLSLKVDATSIEGKLIIAEELLALVAKLDNTIERSEYLKRLAERMNLDEEDLKSELKKILAGRTHSLKSLTVEGRGSLVRAQEILIRFSLEKREALEKTLSLISPTDFTGIYQKIFDKILWLSRKDEKIAPSELISSLGDDLEAGEVISSILLESATEPMAEGMKEKMIEDCVRRIRKERIEKRLESLKDLIKEAESRGELDARLLAEYQHFSKLKNRK
ncbi:MAG: DNA primase [Candidatus Omnitrophica bacterium]|nr:DNA primase [Candidatus Omnitrophota bacterium]